MKKLGFPQSTSANFVHVAFANHASAIHDELRDLVLYRENFGHDLDYSRFSAAPQEMMECVVKSISQWLGLAMKTVY